jgi:hypothetical protein
MWKNSAKSIIAKRAARKISILSVNRDSESFQLAILADNPGWVVASLNQIRNRLNLS